MKKKMIVAMFSLIAGLAFALDITLPEPIATGEQVTSIRVEYGPGIESFIQCARPFVDGEGYGWELIPSTLRIYPVNQAGEIVLNNGWAGRMVDPGRERVFASRSMLVASASELGADWSTASGATINQIVAYTFAKIIVGKYTTDASMAAVMLQSILAQLQ